MALMNRLRYAVIAVTAFFTGLGCCYAWVERDHLFAAMILAMAGFSLYFVLWDAHVDELEEHVPYYKDDSY